MKKRFITQIWEGTRQSGEKIYWIKIRWLNFWGWEAWKDLKVWSADHLLNRPEFTTKEAAENYLKQSAFNPIVSKKPVSPEPPSNKEAYY